MHQENHDCSLPNMIESHDNLLPKQAEQHLHCFLSNKPRFSVHSSRDPGHPKGRSRASRRLVPTPWVNSLCPWYTGVINKNRDLFFYHQLIPQSYRLLKEQSKRRASRLNQPKFPVSTQPHPPRGAMDPKLNHITSLRLRK